MTTAEFKSRLSDIEKRYTAAMFYYAVGVSALSIAPLLKVWGVL
jgi:hypothetical protein